MNSLNSILVEGTLNRDPLLSTTPKGTAVCIFSIESHHFSQVDNESRKEVSLFDVEVWSKLAVRCGEQLTAGRPVRAIGRLVQDRWEDKDGNPRSRVKIVAEHVEFRPMARAEKKEDAPEEFEEDEAGITGVPNNW